MKDPILKLVFETAYHSVGIVPIESTAADYNRYLASLSPEEQRKMKRKFRKLWRKFAKNPGRFISPVYIKQMGLGAQEPSKNQKRARKSEVARRIRQDVITPLKQKLLSNTNTSTQSTMEAGHDS
jgi:hypothetical protein